MTIATTDEQLTLQESVRRWARAAGGTAVVRQCEPGTGADPGPGLAESWAGLADLGVLGAALPESVGGAGCGVSDAAAALEEAAAALVPGPLLPTVLAGLLLARHAEPGLAQRVLPRLVAGELTAATALRADELHAERCADQVIRVSGEIHAVPGATVDSWLILAATLGDTDSGSRGIAGPSGGATDLAGGATVGTGPSPIWFAVGADQPGVTVVAQPPLDFSRPVATVRLDAVAIPADQVLAAETGAEATALAATLAAAEAVGIARWCLRTASEYAAVREQFGRPIGSFQAVKHLCAEMLCRTEEAAATAWDAARAADEKPPPGRVATVLPHAALPHAAAEDERELAVAVAAATALEAAVENAKACIQVLGGIGFTWEHDAHLYLRRALALRQWLGGTDRWRRRVARLALAGVRRSVHLDLDDGGDDEARAFAAGLSGMPPAEQRRALAEGGYLVPHWPAPYGRGAAAREQLAIDRALSAAGIHRPDLVVGGWAVPTVIQHGTDEQRERFVLPTLRGEITWCQLFSEPGAGSDLASLRTRAERVAGGWRLTGQKVWTSVADRADWAICLARTDPTAPKHRGITYFLVKMGGPGLDVRPLREITGDADFNEVFLDGVFVPDADVVGPVDGGWKLARTTLAEERVALGGGSLLGDRVEHLLAAAAIAEPGLHSPARLGALVSEASVVALLELRSTLRRMRAESGDGRPAPAADAVVLKLIGVRHRQAVAEAGYELLGPDGLTVTTATGDAIHELLVSRCLSIAGGTSQILLTMVAERVLGLPREPT